MLRDTIPVARITVRTWTRVSATAPVAPAAVFLS